jgi:hypothetical protein
MTLGLGFQDIVEYTDWERERWLEWFRREGNETLKISAGAHGDGRFGEIGELVRHIFSAEKRYVDELAGRALTDTGTLPTNDAEKLFSFWTAEPGGSSLTSRQFSCRAMGRDAGDAAGEPGPARDAAQDHPARADS